MMGVTHAHIVRKAIDILEKDRFYNYATFARAFESHLTAGAKFPDDEGDRFVVGISFGSILTLGIPVYDYTFSPCNSATFNHYYDPGTGRGLDLGYLKELAELADPMLLAFNFLQPLLFDRFALGPFALLVMPEDIWFTPPLQFDSPYISAADMCQRHYDTALSVWRNNRSADSGRTPWESAMFHLGCACHFAGDCAVSTHTVSNKFWSHDAYEAVALGKEEAGDYNADSVGPREAYGLERIVSEMAIADAVETHPELHYYDENKWDEGMRLALPRAERYAACMIAKFFHEVGVAEEAGPLALHVHDPSRRSIRHALLFYRERQSSPGGLPNRWNLVTTDAQGCCSLRLGIHKSYEIRPALPGYAFKGNYYGDAPTIPEFPTLRSPIIYRHEASPITPATMYVVMEPMVPSLRSGGGVHPPYLPPDILGILMRTESFINEQMKVTAMGCRWGSEPILHMLDLRPGSSVCLFIQVQTFVDLTVGDFVRFRSQVPKLVSQPKTPHVAATTPGRDRPKPAVASASVQSVLARMPTTLVTLPNGSKRTTYDWKRSGLRSPATVGIGLLPLPASAGSEVKVEVERLESFVGFGAPEVPAVVTRTNAVGEAWVRLIPGSQPGRLRIRVTVTSIPGIDADMLPSQSLDLLVDPGLFGGEDLIPATAPTVRAIDPSEYFWPCAPSAPWQVHTTPWRWS